MDNSPITLEDVIPSESGFYLKKRDKTYHVRPFSISDVIWVQKTFGKEPHIMGEIFEKQDWSKIIRIVYHQLVEKEDFLLIEQEEIDEFGRKVKVEISGPSRLLRSIDGIEEGMKVIGAVTKSITDSNPQIKDYIEDALKKNLWQSPAGGASLTKSHQSMDTPLSK